MYYSRYDNNRPLYRPSLTRVRIDNEGPGVLTGADGVIDIYQDAAKTFAVLDQNNVFTGKDNVFEHIQPA